MSKHIEERRECQQAQGDEMHQAEGFRERDMVLSLSYNPTPSTPLGFTARVAPSWGGEARSGAEAMWGRETMTGLGHSSAGDGTRLDTEIGYGLPVGNRFVGTPRAGVSTSEYGRDYRLGYGLDVLKRDSLDRRRRGSRSKSSSTRMSVVPAVTALNVSSNRGDMCLRIAAGSSRMPGRHQLFRQRERPVDAAVAGPDHERFHPRSHVVEPDSPSR